MENPTSRPEAGAESAEWTVAVRHAGLPPRRTSLLAKVLVLFVPLFVLLGALISITAVEAGAVHRNLARVVEENRELETARALSVELRGAVVWVQRTSAADATEGIRLDLREHIERAQVLAGAIGHGPEGEDPSEHGHQEREDNLLGSLVADLARAGEIVRSSSTWDGLAAALDDARRKADVIEAETKEEAQDAALDLDQRVHWLAEVLVIVAGVGILTLVLQAWAFHRLVLRPLSGLREAASRFGRTGAYLPLPIASRDEFGQLTHAFNNMAARLQGARRDLEQRVEERTRELIRTARLADLGGIAAGIAHEINNPLGSIAAGVEGLRRELEAAADTPASTLEYADLVVREAYRANEIAGRLLRFGRQENRTNQPVWLAQAARDVAVMVDYQAREAGVVVRVDFAPDLPPVDSDPNEWRQVFFNLLRNAIDASPRGATVEVSGRCEQDALVIRVRDEGPGFPDEDRDRVFEPFYTTKSPGDGTGLGLAIVERIVREYRGSIHADDWSGGGEIRIALPLHEGVDPLGV